MTQNLVGIGLRQPHYQQVLQEKPAIGWFEVHSENFFQQGGAALDILSAIRENYPLSLHGVGLSLGSACGVSPLHLAAIKKLMERVTPIKISEHLSWSRVGKVHLPDLLPVPYTAESLEIICRNVETTQEFLGREILIENPSSYIEFSQSDFDEADFLVEIAKRTGAKILLDVNNVYVSCSNHGWDAKAYIDAIPGERVDEIHLAGHSVKRLSSNNVVRIDTHDAKVCDDVWQLYRYTVEKFGPKHTLIEWDAQIPELDVLLNEAAKAREICRC